MTLLDCTDPDNREKSLDAAVEAVTHGGLIVLPTDTVYGIAADAFDKDAVAALLAAKGRGRQKPPPVLVGDHSTLDGLATDVPEVVRTLIERFWPGALTIIVRAQPSLTWDLGYTRGTVALRMPDDEIALDVLRRTGPLATSSANRTGRPAATTAAEAQEQLGARVGVYLDGGPARGGEASTIIDATGPTLSIVREGALSVEVLGEVAPELLPPPPEDETTADGEQPAADVEQPDGETAAAPDGETAADAPSAGETATDEAADEPADVEPATDEAAAAVEPMEAAAPGEIAESAREDVEPVDPTDPPQEQIEAAGPIAPLPPEAVDAEPVTRDGGDHDR
ncbi:Sua5/YciO/YrdC/YwlC family protein [Beutenbergia cavernae DSM 12333]|uniref:L-threonylcarbamoyladenylate synthase n=1 Tax=Beutenbergia cavernae (strain ATCC BAA-8 / DSM 12333 / CCUG 43141 / JCM 11478 / NBRC 16432 / NCIMB 13614 / HKI 0122) TaxID=471853 RepID=C5C1T1_BEUC1|nr:L-threonylcarbamoyladenylate synthase [Beutenbergia cavernae]ACQ79549.1 Sua5/YciO/YrdC/YwlC family protein [Beutenbergia cavernae DSM 12333]